MKAISTRTTIRLKVWEDEGEGEPRERRLRALDGRGHGALSHEVAARHRGAADVRYSAPYFPAAGGPAPLRAAAPAPDRAQGGGTDRNRKSRGNTTVTVPVHPEFAESLRAARAAGVVRAEVFTGKFVKGRVLPMNKKAWAAKFKKFAVLVGVNESKKSCHDVRKVRAKVAVRRLHREPDDGDVWLDRPRCPRTTSRGRIEIEIEIFTEFLVVRIAKSPTNPLRRLFGAGSPSWISLYNAKVQIAHRCLERIVPHSA